LQFRHVPVSVFLLAIPLLSIFLIQQTALSYAFTPQRSWLSDSNPSQSNPCTDPNYPYYANGKCYATPCTDPNYPYYANGKCYATPCTDPNYPYYANGQCYATPCTDPNYPYYANGQCYATSCGHYGGYASFFVGEGYSTYGYAEIYVDGQYWGRGSASRLVAAGTHSYDVYFYRYDDGSQEYHWYGTFYIGDCQTFTFSRT
jgi:hypothetical protein